MKDNKEVEQFLCNSREVKNGYFIGGCLKNELGYEIGEKITFKIRPRNEKGFLSVPYVLSEIKCDDGKISKQYVKPSDDGWFYVSTSMEKSGFVRLTASACNDNKEIIGKIDAFDGGAGVDVENIKLGTQIPGDYFEFWQNLISKTAEVYPEVIYSEKYSCDEYANFEFYDVRVKVTDDMYGSFVVSYPTSAKPGTLPLIMHYKGYGVAGINNMVVPGAMLVQVNAHGIANRENDDYYENLKNGELKGYGFDDAENSNPQTTYWAKMFMRDMQILNFVKESEFLDNKNYIFTGGSQGAFQACNMALHSQIATECVLEIPWFTDLGGVKAFGRMPGWRPKYENGLRYFDTAVAASFLQCPITIIAGLGDYICPPSGIMAMFNGIKAEKKLIAVQNMTHSYRPKEHIIRRLGNYKNNEWLERLFNVGLIA